MIYRILVRGTTCTNCTNTIEGHIKSYFPGFFRSIRLLLDQSQTSELRVDCEAENCEEILKAIEDIGFNAEIRKNGKEITQKASFVYSKYFLQAIIIAVFALPLTFLSMFHLLPPIMMASGRLIELVIGIISIPLMIYTGGDYFKNAWNELKAGSTTMDTLIVLGLSGSWIYSMLIILFPTLFPTMMMHVYFSAPLIILMIVKLGKGLTELAKYRVSKTIQSLEQVKNKFLPSTVSVRRQEGDNFVFYSMARQDVQEGDFIEVNPNERVPVDSVLETDSQCSFDEVWLHGESHVILKSKGSSLKAGSILLAGERVLIKATVKGDQSQLDQLFLKVTEAEENSTRRLDLMKRFTRYFVPSVLVVAIMAFIFWMFLGPVPQVCFAVCAFLSVLLSACPCALGLAIPLSQTLCLLNAFRQGIIIAKPQALEDAEEVDIVVFDKTGTLTCGKPEVVNIHSLNDYSLETVLALAAAMEQTQKHSIAQAILRKRASFPSIPLPVVNHLEHHVEGGLSASSSEGESILLGSPNFIRHQGVKLPPTITTLLRTEMDRGKDPTVLVKNGQCIGILWTQDLIRPDALQTVRQLQAQGKQVILLTGAQSLPTRRVAQQLGIQTVYAEQLPNQKIDIINQLKKQGHRVAMVGDGINDLGALSTAHVGFAVGAWADASAQGGIVLQDRLTDILKTFAIAKETVRNYRQNLFWAFFYNILCVLISAGVLFPFFHIMMHPIYASIAMSASSLFVVGNAFRLNVRLNRLGQKKVETSLGRSSTRQTESMRLPVAIPGRRAYGVQPVFSAGVYWGQERRYIR